MIRTTAGTAAYVDNCLTPLVQHFASTTIPPSYNDDALEVSDRATLVQRAAAAARAHQQDEPPPPPLFPDPSVPPPPSPSPSPASPPQLSSSVQVTPLTRPVGVVATERATPSAIPASNSTTSPTADTAAIPAMALIDAYVGGASEGFGLETSGVRGAVEDGATAAAASSSAAGGGRSGETYSSVIFGYDVFNEPEGISWDLRLYHNFM